MPIQGFDRRLQLCGQAFGILATALAPPLLGHLAFDVLPQFPIARHILGNVVGYRNPRQLDDAAFDRIHQRKVADRPREQRAFLVARAGQEKGRCRKVDHPLLTLADLAAHRFQT